MSKPKLQGSWMKQRDGAVHSPVGVEELRIAVKQGLMDFYCGIAESRFRIPELDTDERFSDMRLMSKWKAPWKFLLRNGQCCIFEAPGTDQLHFLPCVMQDGVNMYGEWVHWSPVPYGYDANKQYSKEFEKIMSLKLNDENSVLWMNNLFAHGDYEFINKEVEELVSGQLTENQLMLLQKMPFVFSVTEDNEISAKQFFLSIAQSQPSIFTNRNGDDLTPIVVQTGVKIDPALFDLIDSFHAKIMQYLGLPCVPITKRAQQTVSEVQSNDAEIRLRRAECKRMLDMAAERTNKVFGTSLHVEDVLDEMDKERMQQQQEQQTIGQQAKEKEAEQ